MKKFWVSLFAWIAVVFLSSCLGSNLQIERARELVIGGNLDEAEKMLWEILANDKNNAEANFLMARVFLRKPDNDKALEFAERAVKSDPSKAEYHLWLARAYVANAMESGVINSFRFARRGKGEYEKAVELDPDNVEARFELFMFLVMAPGLVGGDIKKAEEHADIIENLSQLYGSYARAALCERKGDLGTAEKHYIKAVEMDTSSTFFARFALGFFYERQKRIDDALKVFRGILEIKPDMPGALFQVGRIQVTNNGDLDEAERCFKRYLEIEPPRNAPSWASAHWRLGMVYQLKGKDDQALEEYRKAVEMAPKVEEFKKSLRDLERKIKK